MSSDHTALRHRTALLPPHERRSGHTRPLLIIAPTLHESYRAAIAHGLNPSAMHGVRVITRAYALRGIRPGTAFVTINRENWGATARGHDLDRAVTCLQRAGRIRPAQADDIAAANEGEG